MVPRVQVDTKRSVSRYQPCLEAKISWGKVASEKKMIMIEKKSMSARTKAKFLKDSKDNLAGTGMFSR